MLDVILELVRNESVPMDDERSSHLDLLVALAPHLSESERLAVSQQLLEFAKHPIGFDDLYSVRLVMLLSTISPYLRDDVGARCLEAALKLIKQAYPERIRVRCIELIAPHLRG